MDYTRIYNQLIAAFRNKMLDGYTESHHIVPRCMGGGNEPDNLVDLPARYHFVAHLLLAKVHGGPLIHAAFMMSNMKRYSSRQYEWVRIKYIASITGVTRTPDYCAKMSEALSGENNYWYGKQLSDEHKRKLRKPKTITPKVIAARKAITGKPLSEETRRKISEAQKGRKMSPEAIAKSVATRKKNGYVHSEEVRAKMRAAWLSRKSIAVKHNPREIPLKKKRVCVISDAQRVAISKALTGRRASLETRQKLSKARLGNKNGRGLKGRKRPDVSKRLLGNKINIGRRLSPEHRSKIAASNRARGTTSESAKKSWETRRKNGTDKHSPEAKARMSANHASMVGLNNPMHGKKHSAETRAKIAIKAAAHMKGNQNTRGMRFKKIDGKMIRIK